MPLREYQATDENAGCETCRTPFEHFERMGRKPLTRCPSCGAPLRRLWSSPAIGASASGFDNRAKSAGFHKLQRLGTGEYEKKY